MIHRLLPAALLVTLVACAPASTITTFEDCVAAGNPVMESFPRQCRTQDGATFTENIGNVLEKQDLIRVTNPRPNDALEGAVVIAGEARGTWYFEASFPVRLVDANGAILAESHAQAQGEWMTENFVPFTASLTIPPTTAQRGMLILEKDNPSGLPELADALRMPVRFK